MATPIYRGDDTNSFGQEWVRIEADIPSDWVVTLAEFKVGNLPSIPFDYPVFPLYVSLNASQTAELKDENSCYLAIYDEDGLKQTLEGTWRFTTKKRVV